MILMGWAGVFFTGIKPLVLSAYKDHLGFGDDLAGYLVAIETTGLVVASLCVTLRIHLWNRRLMGGSGLALMLIGNLASMSLSGFSTLAAVRFLVGCGEGLAMGVMSGSLAGTARPDRNFAIYTAAILGIEGLGLAAIPFLLETFDLNGIFLLLIVLLVPAALTLPLLPSRGPQTNGGAEARASWEDLPAKPITVVIVGGVLAYLGIGGFSPFLGEVGRVSGLEEQMRANTLAVAQFFGLMGALAAMWQGLRWGRTPAVVVGLVIMAGSVGALLMAPNSPPIYIVSIQAFLFMWLYFFAYLAGLTASLDPGGRVTVLMFTTTGLGFAAGPAINGWIVQQTGDYVAIKWLTIASLLVALIFLIPIARRQDRRLARFG